MVLQRMVTPGDSYCGIFCGACSVARHGETGRGDAFTACLGSVTAKDLACGGCKSDALYAGCRSCRLRECAVARHVEHCVDCADYPCRIYRGWQSAGRILPHAERERRGDPLSRRRGLARRAGEALVVSAVRREVLVVRDPMRQVRPWSRGRGVRSVRAPQDRLRVAPPDGVQEGHASGAAGLTLVGPPAVSGSQGMAAGAAVQRWAQSPPPAAGRADVSRPESSRSTAAAILRAPPASDAPSNAPGRSPRARDRPA